MSDRTMQADPADDALAPAIARWSGQPELSAVLAGGEAAFLVLDAGAARVLHASRAASALRAGIAGADGLVAPVLNLSAQVGAVGRVGERPRLARLRRDPRGIAPAATCLVARAALDGTTDALILAPAGPVPALRPLAPARADAGDRAEPAPPPAGPAPSGEDRPEPAPGAPRQDGRLVWRSDAADVLQPVSGDEAVSRALAGRSWPELFAAGTVAGDRLSAAIAQRVTFRALGAVLATPDGSETIEIDLSGAPSARSHRPFAGFSGFGLIRARRPVGPHAAQSPPPADEPAAAPPEAALSANEHAAFREIARSLGVRFAGDDGPAEEAAPADADGSEPPPTAPRGSVTPFPAPSRAVPAAPGVADLLDALPAAVLIHRDGAALYANPRLLALTGFSDLPALRAAGGLAGLMRDASTEEGGDAAALVVERAAVAWDGAPAELVLARPGPRIEPPREPLPPQTRRDDAVERAAGMACVLHSLPEGVVTLDEAGRVLTLNARAEALLGAAGGTVPGDAFASLFPDEAGLAIEAALAAARHGGTGEARAVLRRGGGAPVPLSLRVAGLPEGAARFCVALRDRTETEAGEAEIRRQAEAAAARKADFLAKVSREIRTPLNGILGFADAMLGEPYGPLASERYREYLRDIHASGSHVLHVIDDLLDLARIEAGRADLSFTDIPLNDLVSGCIALMQPQAARDRIVVRTSLAPELTTLVADERSMRQAALNVIANAIRFTEAGGQVIVSTMIAERGEIALRVRDTGVGMTTQEVEDALHPFARIGVAGPNPGGGTGLGLTLTKALVEANRGRFRITSRKHEGTLVEMVFPAAEARRA